MKIFRKTFITVFTCFFIIIIFLSYILAINHIDDSENSLIEQNRIYGRLISKQIEVGYLQSDWPYETLNELSNRDDFIFWWVVKDDGSIYRSDNISFMKTNAYDYFPQLENQVELDDTIYSNSEKNYAIYFKSFNYGNEVWTIWIGFSLDEIYLTSMNIIITVVLAVVVTLMVIFIILYLLVKSFTNPIVKLWKTVSEIGKGNFEVNSDIKSKDEIGQLASEFNIMTKNLNESRNKIEEYSKNLEKLLKQKDEFIYQLGHDLKSPLNPLVNLLPLLQRNIKDPESQKIIDILKRNTRHIQNIVLKTLELAKLNSSEFTLNIENLNLLSVLNDSIVNHKFVFNEGNFTVENNVDKNIMIQADKTYLKEVFDNLFTNAIKYSSGDDKKIIINASSYKKGDILVSVKDNGRGMTYDQQKFIFDEFYKTDPSRHDLDSSGLGLTICKRIIERLDGKIWVESSGLGKGTTVFFTVPSKF